MEISETVVSTIKSGKGTIVDVRTPEEFNLGNAKGSVNIPMYEVTGRLEEIRRLKHPLVICCASGNRSSQVISFLSSRGLPEIYNGGSWKDIENIINPAKK